MTEPDEKVKWRIHFNQLIARPIPETEYPKLIQRMFDDGLLCVLSPDGYQYFCGRYPVTAAAVRRLWGLSRAQWGRFMDYVYREDPFSHFGGDETDEKDMETNGG